MTDPWTSFLDWLTTVFVPAWGELIGLFLTERIPQGIPPVEAARRIRDQGGIVYVPPGVFGVTAADNHNGALEIQSNVFIKGAGIYFNAIDSDSEFRDVRCH